MQSNNQQEPKWLLRTKRLFPHPLFSGGTSIAFLILAIIFIGVGISERIWPMACVAFVFLTACIITAVATVSHVRNRHLGAATQPVAEGTAKPTFAIMILLVGIYSWLLTAAMHIFNAIFPNGPGSLKYNLTLALAISATVFMRLFGYRLLRKHFGRRGGRGLELTPRQAVYVVGFVAVLSAYFVWIAS